MGFFDFFRNKKKNSLEINNGNSNSNKLSKEDLDNLVLTALNVLCDDVSSTENAKRVILSKGYNEHQASVIVDRANELYLRHFNKKQITSLHIKDEEKKESNRIEVTFDNTGKHGDNFGGLFGFNYLESDHGYHYLREMIAFTSVQNSTLQNSIAKIHEHSFEDNGLIRLRSITKKINNSQDIVSAYPYLYTNYILPFETRKIIEWSHASCMEAEITGGGRNTFGLTFFATDYAVNKERYKVEKKLNIKISAIALVLDLSNITEINGNVLSEEFSTYMPNKDMNSTSYFDFIGILNSFKKCNINEHSYGYILNVKLINQETDPSFFTIDVFINKENMRMDELVKGMKLTGLLWFQGEICN